MEPTAQIGMNVMAKMVAITVPKTQSVLTFQVHLIVPACQDFLVTVSLVQISTSATKLQTATMSVMMIRVVSILMADIIVHVTMDSMVTVRFV